MTILAIGSFNIPICFICYITAEAYAMIGIIREVYNRAVTIYRNFTRQPYVRYTYRFIDIEWRPRYFNGD